MVNSSIAILLSVFNGEEFLEQQIDSIINQDFDKFRLYIRDDSSSDDSLKIIKKYLNKYPKKIKLVNNFEKENIGVRDSFELLMQNVKSEAYFAFCDQDDIWCPDKLKILLNEIQSIEVKVSLNTPILVFSDMQIVSEKLDPFKSSFYKKLNGFDSKKLDNGLYQGCISGCLMLFNKKARDIYFAQNRLFLHDYNLFLSTFINGVIGYVDIPLVKHRIHRNNFFGLSSTPPLKADFLDFFKFIFNNKKYRMLKLKNYFDFVDVFINEDNKLKSFKRELFNQQEVDMLPYLKRKKWYIDHFLPFYFGYLRGLIYVVLI